MNRLIKIKNILSPSQRLRSLGLLVGVLIGTALEMLGIGLVLPIIALILNPESLRNHEWASEIIGFLGNPEDSVLITYALATLVCAYVLKTIFMVVLALFQYRFVYRVAASVSQRLFSCYLRVPYIFHVQNNSSHLLRNLTTESQSFLNSLEGLMVLITEITVLCGLFLVLLLVDPFSTVVGAFLILFIVVAIYTLTRSKILVLGTRRLMHEGMRTQYIMQGLATVKEIKLLRREEGFLSQYGNHNYGLAMTQASQNFVQAAPRFVIELIAVTALVGFIVTQFSKGESIEDILPVLGIFGAAAFRMLPSLNRILAAKQKVRFMSVAVDTIHSELKMEEHSEGGEKDTKPFEFKNNIDFSSVSYKYPSAVKNALNDLNLVINQGESIGIIGGSGAGKTTFVDILLGLLSPSRGSISVDGVDIANMTVQWQKSIGYVPQDIRLTDESIKQNVALGISEEEIDVYQVTLALKAAKLFDYVCAMPDGIETVVGERGIRISGGQRQRLGIARALYHAPKILVLDEATSALDTATESEVMESVKEMQGEKTLIIVAHRTSTLINCDRVVRIAHGAIAEIISREEFQKSL
jgi:ABC-type multidrug transport system fused ATPase/permease subunit